MTTIAFRDGILAADSCASDDQQKMPYTKLRRMGEFVFGFCGDCHAQHDFVSKFKAGTSLDKMRVRGDLQALLLMPDGSCMRWDKAGGVFPIEGKFAAVGSGAGYALGAMEKGVTAREAVRIACKYDPCSGPPVRHRTATRRK